jgi:molybdenum-dependent DNA-binding transcriptional regulator ModE
VKDRRLPFDGGRSQMKATNEQIIQAYRDTGSVWAAAKRLGMCGQSVWERLRALDHPMANADWTEIEIEELRRLAGNCTIGEIANRLGRPYAGVAGKISRLQLGIRYGNQLQRKRVTGYPKKRVLKLIGELEGYDGSLRQFCRDRSLDLEYLIGCIQRIDRPFWEDYTRRRSDLTSKTCPNCGETYYPLTKKQRTCSRRCSDQVRVDTAYFGGKRRYAIGLAEGVCQLCMTAKPRLSAHHVLGKDNDPDNEFLIALCAGCHQVLGILAGRIFTDTEQGWENLMNLVLARRLADKNRDGQSQYVGTHVAVDIDWLTREDLETTGALDEAVS